MVANFVAILTTFLVLGVLVLFHEFGHFAVAKLCRVRVEVFSLGFGKRLLGFRKGDTDYRISAIPLGGYVKMSGENPMEDTTGSPDEFSSHPRWQRFLIAIAGPAMNVLLSIVVLTGLYMWRFPREAYLEKPAVIGYVDKASIAEKAGLQAGDRIVRVDNTNTASWQEVLNQFELNVGRNTHITIDHAGTPQDITLPLTSVNEEDSPQKTLGLWEYEEPLLVTQLEPGMPAVTAGVQVNDAIVAVDNTHPHAMKAIQDYLQEVKGNPIHLTVMRAGQPQTLVMTPVLDQEQDKYRIGFLSVQVHDEKLSLPLAFAQSLKQNKQTSMLIVQFLGRIVEHKTSVRSMKSIVGMTQITKEVLPGGFPAVLELLALISVNLGIFNLLPIPILDGGVILLLLIEGVMRRELNRQLKERIYQAAFVFLLVFAVLVIFNDIAKIAFPHKM